MARQKAKGLEYIVTRPCSVHKEASVLFLFRKIVVKMDVVLNSAAGVGYPLALTSSDCVTCRPANSAAGPKPELMPSTIGAKVCGE